MSDTNRLYLGIDAGGTHTLAVVVSATGDVLSVGRSGAANHVSMGISAAHRSISQAVEQALCGGRLQPRAVAFGSSGLEEPGDLQVARQLLPEHLWNLPIVFDCDAVMALEGALGGEPGIVVTAGTGAIAFGRDAVGRRANASGWGWRVGDEGSAYWLGQEAIRAICRAEDGRGPATQLTAAVLADLKLNDCRELRDWVYVEKRTPSDIAHLAVVVGETAAAGDELANGLLVQAAHELAAATEAVGRRLGFLDQSAVYVSFTGGVFQSSIVRTHFEAEIARRQIPAELHEPILAPVGGAGLHAWRLGQLGEMAVVGDSSVLWQVEIPESVVNRLKLHMPGVTEG